jgi:hypothetical protein
MAARNALRSAGAIGDIHGEDVSLEAARASIREVVFYSISSDGLIEPSATHPI